MKKIIPFLFAGILFTAFQCNEDTDPENCIDPDKITEGACTLDYNPVCGCNEVTYPNACAADLSGVISYTPGECD